MVFCQPISGPLSLTWFFLFRLTMDALRRAKSERGGHRGIVTKTIRELEVLLVNPADPHDLAAANKQLQTLNVCRMKLERERDALPAFDEEVQAEVTDEQELEDNIINADDIQTTINLKLLALETLTSRLPRGHTPHPSVPTRSTSTTPIVANADGDSSPLPPCDRPASSPTPPIAAAATTPFSVSNLSIVLAAATDAAIPPPSNDVRLSNLAPPKFSDDRPLDWQTSLTAGVDRNNLCAGEQQFHNVRARLSGSLSTTNANDRDHAIALQPRMATHTHAQLYSAPPSSSATQRDMRVLTKDEINDGINSILDRDCVPLSRSSRFQSTSLRPDHEPNFSSLPDSSLAPTPNVTDFPSLDFASLSPSVPLISSLPSHGSEMALPSSSEITPASSSGSFSSRKSSYTKAASASLWLP